MEATDRVKKTNIVNNRLQLVQLSINIKQFYSLFGPRHQLHR